MSRESEYVAGQLFTSVQQKWAANQMGMGRVEILFGSRNHPPGIVLGALEKMR